MPNTGYKAYGNLEEYYLDNNMATGVIKTNSISDPDYIPPVLDYTYCPLPSLSPSATPSITRTPSRTVSITRTPSVTPSITKTPSITRTTSATPSITPSVTRTISATPSITPSITKSISTTPSITPSVTSGYNYYIIDTYECGIIGTCNYINTIFVKTTSTLAVNKFYLVNNQTYTLIYVSSTTSSGLYTTLPAVASAGYNDCSYLCTI
jgi:hypothetical protein